MLDRRDPEYSQNLAFENWKLDQYWRRGQIGDVTYIRSCMLNGDTPADANTRLNLLKMETPAERYGKGRKL